MFSSVTTRISPSFSRRFGGNSANKLVFVLNRRPQAISNRTINMTSATESKIQLVILDIDGTLVDSNDAHARAFDKAFREQGYNFSYDEIRKLIGMGSDNLIPRLTGLKEDSPEFKKISERKSEVFSKEEMPNLKPFPKAKEFVQALTERNLKVTIASSAAGSELEKYEKLIGIESFITTTTSSDDVDNSKPDADVIQKILEKMKIRPEQSLMVGDTPYDIQSAAKAKVRTVIVRCGGFWSENDFRGALAIYDSPADILEHLDENPFMSPSKDTQT
jgi:HAD superfamily hydrolase (TIGR01549 family)